MRIKAKLSFGVMAAVSVTLLLGLIFFWSNERSRESVDLLEMQVEKAELMADLKLAISETVMPANDFIITGDQKYLDDFRKLDRKAELLYKKIKESSLFSVTEKKTVLESATAYQGLKRVSLQILASDPRDAKLPGLMEEMDYTYAAPAIDRIGALREGVRNTLAAARLKVDHEQTLARQATVSIIIILAFSSLFFGITLSRSIVLPLNRATRMLQEIAEGRGDLTRRLEVSSRDELGEMAYWFNRFTDGLQTIVKGILDVSHKVSSTSQVMLSSTKEIYSSANQQMSSTEVTAVSVQQLHASVNAIAEEAREVSEHSAEVADTSEGMSEELTVIARQAEQLEELTDHTSSSINEIVASLQQIFASIDNLSDASGSVVASGNQINASIGEIGVLAMEQALTAERVKDEATERGMNAARQNRIGIERVKEESEVAARTAQRLDRDSRQIGEIVGMITDIAEQTTLLSFNATILAAQAGEHGRGFAVVAGQIKELSLRTSVSAKKINNLVEHVRADIAATVLSAERTMERASEGLQLSATAEKALVQIVTGAEASLTISKQVENALEEQLQGLNQVLQGIDRSNAMLDEIKRAAAEQRKASHVILVSTEDVLQNARGIRAATANSSRAGQKLSTIMAEVAARMGKITRSTDEQRQAAKEIFHAIEMIRHGADRNVTLTSDFDRMAGDLETESKVLHAQMANFQI